MVLIHHRLAPGTAQVSRIQEDPQIGTTEERDYIRFQKLCQNEALVFERVRAS
jgi:hypothetical protein